MRRGLFTGSGPGGVGRREGGCCGSFGDRSGRLVLVFMMRMERQNTKELLWSRRDRCKAKAANAHRNCLKHRMSSAPVKRSAGETSCVVADGAQMLQTKWVIRPK